MPERVLLVCTSNERNVRQAASVLRDKLFSDLDLDLLCTLKDLPAFEKDDRFNKIMVFPGRQQLLAAFHLWLKITRRHYRVISVLWCLDAGRTRPKLFALTCWRRRLLVFNENLDCDYLSWAFLSRLVRARASNGTLSRSVSWNGLLQPLEDGYWGMLRFVTFPLRLMIISISVLSLFLGKGLGRHESKVKRPRHV